jgi:hypothetical protein
MELLDLAMRGSPHFAEIDAAFGRTLRTIEHFVIAPDTSGAFRLDRPSRTMFINSVPLCMLMGQVLKDVKDSQQVLAGPEIPRLLCQVFRVYLLHEIRHIPQGLADIETVRSVKRIAGEEFMSDLDLFADRDAAAAYAALEADKISGNRADYLASFREALFFSGQYSFPVFRFSSSRPPKMARAVGLTLMASRLSLLDLSTKSIERAEKAAPLDSCLIVKMADDYSAIVLASGAANSQTITVNAEVADNRLKRLVDHIENARFLDALDTASVVLRGLNVVG